MPSTSPARRPGCPAAARSPGRTAAPHHSPADAYRPCHSTRSYWQTARLRHAPQIHHQLLERQLALQELTRHPAAVEHDDAVSHRMHVEDVVVNEQARLARRFDVADEIQHL